MTRVTYIICILLPLLLQCTGQNSGSDISPKEQSITDILAERSNQFHTELESRGLIYPDSLALALLHGIGIPTAETLFPNEQITFNVIRKSTVNAFALPNGNTYFTIGLLMRMETPSQLAFVIAHELSHVKLKHGISTYQRRKQTMVSAHIFDLMLFGTGLAYIPAAASQAQFSRTQEFEADDLGLTVITELGYPIDTVHQLFDIFEQISPAASVGWSLYRSHPTNHERKERVHSQIPLQEPDQNINPEFTEELQELHTHLFHEYVQNTLLQKEYLLTQDIVRPAVTKNLSNPLYHYYAGELYLAQAIDPDETAEDYARFHSDVDLKILKNSYLDSISVWYQYAESEFEETLSLDSSFVLGYRGLGLVAYNQQKYQDGIKYLQHYLTHEQLIPDRKYLNYLITKMEREL